MTAPTVEHEYTQMHCDAWQMHHLANDWRERYGWEVVSVIPDRVVDRVPSVIGDDDSADVPAVDPVRLLFRRPIRAEEEDE